MDQKLLSDHRHDGQEWMSCTLCRSLNQSKSVLYRSLQRKVDWSQPHSNNTKSTEYTSVDDAFSSVLQYMNTTTRQCKRYYKTCGSRCGSSTDHEHYGRFHSHGVRKPHTVNNPLQRADNVNVNVQPGTYAVTVGEWGSGHKQTHIVDVAHGQSVNLDFIM